MRRKRGRDGPGAVCAAEGVVAHNPGRVGPQEGPEEEQRPQEEVEEPGPVAQGHQGQRCWHEAERSSTQRNRRCCQRQRMI
jgi:hypothetical protein